MTVIRRCRHRWRHSRKGDKCLHRERERDGKKEVTRSRTAQLNQKKPEVRNEVCNFCSVVTGTSGVL
jgi:hypothetical protein